MMANELKGAKAVLYARVSTDDKDQNPETQLVMMRDYCKEHGIEIVEEFSEMVSGGSLADRHEWNSLMGRVMAGGITMILARDESRISRNMHDMSDITKLLEIKGTVIRYLDSPVMPEDDTGQLLNMINTWHGQQTLKNIRINTSEAMQEKKRKGYHVGRFAKFVFKEDIEEWNRIAKGYINEDPNRSEKGEVTIIRSEESIYSYAREGYPLTYVAHDVLHISHSTLISMMKPREEEPDHYVRTKGGKLIPCYRNHGLKDRYTVYMTLYDEAISSRKAVKSERYGLEG